MRTKLIEVSYCRQCPFFYQGSHGDPDTCSILGYDGIINKDEYNVKVADFCPIKKDGCFVAVV
jgi:hypothetical protein